MDSLTQAALGAIVGERCLGRSLGRKALAWGAFVGTLPDLDILAYPFLDTIGQLYWHRGFSHSALGILILGPLLAWILHFWWKRKLSTHPHSIPSISFRRVLTFVVVNFATHVIIDCFTMYGTQLAEPFSSRRFGLNNLFIIDPLFTAPMLLWIAAALFRRKKPGVASREMVALCGVLLLGYTTFSFAAQSRADQRLREELRSIGVEPLRGRVTASPFNTLVWRGIYETEDSYWIGYWAVTDSDEDLPFSKVPRRVDLLEPHRGDRAIDCALWFSEEFLLVEPQEDGISFLVTDLRFVEFWPPENNGLPKTFFAWKVAPAKGDEPAIFEPSRVRRPEVSNLFRALGERLQGDRDALLPYPYRPSS